MKHSEFFSVFDYCIALLESTCSGNCTVLLFSDFHLCYRNKTFYFLQYIYFPLFSANGYRNNGPDNFHSQRHFLQNYTVHAFHQSVTTMLKNYTTSLELIWGLTPILCVAIIQKYVYTFLRVSHYMDLHIFS